MGWWVSGGMGRDLRVGILDGGIRGGKGLRYGMVGVWRVGRGFRVRVLGAPLNPYISCQPLTTQTLALYHP